MKPCMFVVLLAGALGSAEIQDPGEIADRYADLYQAVGRGDARRVAAMIDGGLDPNAPHLHGETFLMRAAHRGHLSVVDLLLRRGAKVDQAGFDGVTALLFPSGRYRVQIARRLLAAGADPNGVVGGTPPLDGPAGEGDLKLIDLLLEAGAKVDLPNRQGYTALMWAAREGKEAAVRRLLRAGADPAAKNRRGQTARDLAVQGGRKGVARLLSGLSK